MSELSPKKYNQNKNIDKHILRDPKNNNNNKPPPTNYSFYHSAGYPQMGPWS
jgi:hypothetical protein